MSFNIDDASSFLATASSQNSNPLLLRVDDTGMDLYIDEEITTEQFDRGLDGNLLDDILDPNSIEDNVRKHPNNNSKSNRGQRSQYNPQQFNHYASRRQNSKNKYNKRRRSNRDDDDDGKHNKRKQPLPCGNRSNCQQCKEKQKIIDHQAEVIKSMSDKYQDLLAKYHQLASQVPYSSPVNTPILKSTTSNDNYSKRKPKKQTKQQNKSPYDSMLISKLKKSIRITRKLTESIIPSTIKESFNSPYKYILSTIALDAEKFQCSKNLEICTINCDFHDKNNNERLYCVASRCNERKYQWKVEEELISESELEKIYNISNIIFGFLPQPSGHMHYLPGKRMNHKVDDLFVKLIVLAVADRVYCGQLIIWRTIEPMYYVDVKLIKQKEQLIMDLLNNKQTFDGIIRNTKWSKIPVFNIKTKNQRVTFTLTNDAFKDHCMEENEIKLCVIPILMADKDEYLVVKRIKISQISEKHYMNIAISLKYEEKEDNHIKVTGIHLDKAAILEQHQLLLQQHAMGCHCLDSFERNDIINNFRIGNLDEDNNKIKDLKKQVNKLKNNMMNSPSPMSLPSIMVSPPTLNQQMIHTPITSHTPVTSNNTPITNITPPTQTPSSITPLPNVTNNSSNQPRFPNTNQQSK